MGLEAVNKNAKGGTELLIDEFKQHVPEEIYKSFQIVPSRFRGFESGKIPIYWAHDLPGDPECGHLKEGGFEKYEKLVFVSNWQMQGFINYYQIPWSKCIVIQNAINPIPFVEKPKDKIKLIYHTTPHRGLEILAPVFERLCEKHDNIELDVYSSFKIYGWEQRDEQYAKVFESLKAMPNVNYFGSVDYNVVREALTKAHIFAYPSIWMETSCRALMEAMTSGLLCVHSNYGCLYETAGGWTWMYQYQDNPQDHAMMLYHNLDAAISNYWDESIQTKLQTQSSYSTINYSWEIRKHQWVALLKSILQSKNISI